MISKLVRERLPGGVFLIATAGLLPEDLVELLPKNRTSAQSPTLVDLDALDPGSPPSGPASGAVVVVARTYTDLRRAVSLASLLPATTHLVLSVVDAPQHRIAFPRIGPDWPAVRELSAHHEPDGGWLIEARFAKPLGAGQVLAAIVRDMDGNPPQQVLRVALAGAGAAHWRPGDPGAVPIIESGPLEGPNGFLPADLVLRSVVPNPVKWTDSRVTVVDRPQPALVSWSNLGQSAIDDIRAVTASLTDVDSVPPVDERSVNPSGFLATPTMGVAELIQMREGWGVQGGGAAPVPIHPSGVVTDADIAKLRQLRAVSIEWGRHLGPISAVMTVAGLSAAGVPLLARSVPGWAAALGAELIELMTSVKADDLEDDLRREEHSIRLRRAALRTHSTQARWRNLAAAAGLPVPAAPRISVLLCTRRPEYISFALAQIARQRYVDLEVILTLHGLSGDLPEVRRATETFDRPLTVVEVADDVIFGDALNRGAAAASGRYLAKWDDDDWYGPEFLADAMLAMNYSGADLVGCLHQFIYLEQIDLTVRRQGGESERLSRRISGNSLVMDRHIFDAVGGFPPIPRSVDTGLLRAIEAAGGRIYRTHGMASMVHRRQSGHTWNPPITGFLRAASRQWRGFKPAALMDADEIIGHAVSWNER